MALYCWGNNDSRFDDVQIEPVTERSLFAGGSHGGRGGGADGFNRVYGSLFDPDDPGSGGTGLGAAAGGGVVRIAAVGEAIIDGSVRAAGEASSVQHPSSAGGSIRLDATTIRGFGSIDASGGDGRSLPAAGGGGRIALYGATISEGLIDRTLAAGGDADTPEQRGAAGTIFVKRDVQPLGDLILDNGGLDTAQPTELLSAGPGTIDAVTPSSITDDQADFTHDLAGLEIFFNGDRSALWPITGHAHRGQTLSLDTSSQALGASVGDTYEGLYRFDRVIVRGGAEAVTRSAVDSLAPEVEAGSSWTDEYRESLVITSPVDGLTFTAGDLMTIAATSDDLFGVESVRFEMDGEVFVDRSSPFEWTVRLKPVSGVTSRVVVASAIDGSGNVLSDQVTLTIQPWSDSSAPTLDRAPCPRDGDLVLDGQTMTFDTTVIDDGLLYRQSVFINGVVIDEVLGVDQPTAHSVVSWSTPTGVAPGTAFTVEIQAEDYGGNLTSEILTLTVPVGTVLTGDQALDSTQDGVDLVLSEGVFTLASDVAPSSLTLMSGATLVTTSGAPVSITTNGEARLQCGAAIDVTALGYRGGHSGHPDGYAPAGVQASSPDAGGSHGGSGDLYDGEGSAGEVYDSVYAPALAGGGGALRNETDTAYESGAGGGVVEITAGTLVLDGEILARGESLSSKRSGGAGGSVLIDVAGSLSGSGRIDVSGGESNSAYTSSREGAGGGGRVALYAGSFSGFEPGAQIEAFGGWTHYGGSSYGYAAPGTILVFTDGASTHGDLIVDAGTDSSGAERASVNTELPSLGTGSVGALEAADTDAWLTTVETLGQRWVGAWMVLEDSSGGDLGAFRVVEIDPSGRALLSGAGLVAGAATFRGEYRFDALLLRHGAGLVASDRLDVGSVVVEGSSRLLSSATVHGDATVSSGGLITAGPGDRISLHVVGTFTLEVGAKIDVSSLGYRGGHSGHPDGYAPAGVQASSPDAGGSHGGSGDLYDGAGPAGEVYDSVYAPMLAGGGGALRNDTDTAYESGAGGGVVEITAGSMVLDGEILARGESLPSFESGGAGGSVLIDVSGSFSGNGRIDVSGGESGSSYTSSREGAGGGGRVALYAGSFSGFDAGSQVSAVGERPPTAARSTATLHRGRSWCSPTGPRPMAT